MDAKSTSAHRDASAGARVAVAAAETGPGPAASADVRRALAIAVVANLVGGASYALTKIALGGLTETTVIVVRTVVALAVLLPMARGRLAPLLRARGADRRHLLAVGVIGYALPLVLGSYGLRRSTATNAALLIGTEPLGVVLLSAFVLHEVLTRARLIALALGIVGATVLVTNGIPFVTVTYAAHPVGDVLLVAHGFAWSVYTVAAKRLLARYDPIAVSAGSLLVALPCLLAPAAIEASTFAWDTTRLAPALAAAVTLGLVVSAGMTVLWNRALRHLDASRMAGLIFLQPLTGMLLGVALLGEPVTPYALLGSALILVGVFVVAQEERAKISPPLRRQTSSTRRT
jgi:drug/metabolite transporter (DMT)-like permease